MPNFHTSLQEIPIFTRTYQLYKVFYETLPSFPKKDRYTLGQKCELVLLDLLEAIILASSLPKHEKLPVLRKASYKLDLIKVLFQLAKDLKVLENKRYVMMEKMLQEIGKMLGGWIKTTSI